jgi:hypothetical protein
MSRSRSRSRSRSKIAQEDKLRLRRKHSKTRRSRSRSIRRSELRVKRFWFNHDDSLPTIIEPSANEYFTESSTLGIYMLCHGAITSTFTKSPNIPILKQNIGPFGYCTNLPLVSSTRHKSRLKILLSLTNPDTDKAMKYFTQTETYCSIITNADETFGSCEQFSVSPLSTIMNKIYSNSDNNITVDENYKYMYFAYRDKIVNLFDCDDATLYDFFSIPKLNSMLFKNLVVKGVKSTHIFMLINKLTTHLGITHVNILDESCNIPYSGTIDALRQFKHENQIEFYGGENCGNPKY